MVINRVHHFTSAEENLITEALLALAETFKDKDGHLRSDLTRVQQRKFNDIMDIYRSF